jgi:hypothetical protein
MDIRSGREIITNLINIMKKRAALCMRGAIAKKNDRYSFKDSIYTGQSTYINFTAVHQSIKHHIIDANPDYDVDVFIHSWSYDMKDELLALYQPKRSLFEDNRLFNNEIEAKCISPSDFGGISQALAIRKVIELKEAYEEDECFKYDIVVIFRPDVLIWRDMVLSQYDLSYFYTDGHDNCNGDMFFIMNTSDAHDFKGLYESLNYGNRHIQHAWIKTYLIKYCNLEIRQDSLVPGRDYEVLRHIWQTSIVNKYVTLEMLHLYGITNDDITAKEILY